MKLVTILQANRESLTSAVLTFLQAFSLGVSHGLDKFNMNLTPYTDNIFYQLLSEFVFPFAEIFSSVNLFVVVKQVPVVTGLYCTSVEMFF